MRSLALREAGAAILFFGALAQRHDLKDAGGEVLEQLSAQGFTVPSEDAPVRVFPALTGGGFSGNHAGGWRPGTIYLRQRPQGEIGDVTYLRHELYHEASFRTCRGRMPLWAEEAGAMAFSGELAGSEPAAAPTESELTPVRQRIAQRGQLQERDLAILARLVRRMGWPIEPCKVLPAMAAELGANVAGNSALPAYVLMSMASGRVLEQSGDVKVRYPPGSLLKIPYAASLNEASPVDLAAELVASDTAKLLRRWDQIDLKRLRRLLSPVRMPDRADLPAAVFLGERSARGDFPIEANLIELGRIMRAALLLRPAYFDGLRRNGTAPDSTLSRQGPAERDLLERLRGMAKTGTVSSERGDPMVGHLLVAWPAEHPVYLAVFRQPGVQGAAVLGFATERLRNWQASRPARLGLVRVKLLGLTPRASWGTVEDCPSLSPERAWLTLCGSFRILSSAPGSRSERMLTGVIYYGPHGESILETDSESYADAVMQAEARDLTGAARDAMRAVVLWNGAHGGHRHGDTTSLCDTSHCMVFLGLPTESNAMGASVSDPGLLSALDELSRMAGHRWFSFASGGTEPWVRELRSQELAELMGESQVLSVRRELRKQGGVFVRLVYPGNEDVMTCEVFRNALKLPACPSEIGFDGARSAWSFRGIGAGHGEGLSIARARSLSDSGYSALEILMDAYAH